MNLASIYASIGPSGIALVFVGCAGLYLALRNLLYLHFVWRDFKRDFLDIEHQEGRCMRDVCDKSDNPLIAIIRDVVKTHGGHSEDIRAEGAYLFHRNFEQVTKGLCWLRLISVVSPLLGLLGTILGMVTVFRTIAENSAPNAAQLAAGIWEALITTIMGLCVAIPMLMFYYYLMLKFKGFHIEAVEHSWNCAAARSGKPGPKPGGRAMHDFDEDASIDLTPVIDVIFMLLIFFIMTTTFSKPVLDIVLPASETAEESSRKNAELVISVKADGTIHYQDRQLTKEALAAVLETRPEALLNLYVDEKAPFEAFVGVVDIARLKRGGHFVISTQPSER